MRKRRFLPYMRVFTVLFQREKGVLPMSFVIFIGSKLDLAPSKKMRTGPFLENKDPACPLACTEVIPL